MGGRITVESEVDKGSVFKARIAFPITELSPSLNQLAGMTDEVYSDYPIERVAAADARVLVAEDYPLNQAFISRLLKQIGIGKFRIVENGQEAIMEISHNPYDIILMDCHMPIVNGYDATIEIREAERRMGTGHTPIIAMTANAMVGDKERCIECGMDEYISKPVDFDLFKRIVSKWIDFGPMDAAGNSQSSLDNEMSNYIPERPLYDLSYIRDIADGDEDIEKEFIELYISQTDENLELLKQNCVDGMSTEWTEIAHKLKGGAGSVGAVTLVDLFATSQNMRNATLAERESILSKIMAIYSDLKKELKKETI